jgi:hypothetical protein
MIGHAYDNAYRLRERMERLHVPVMILEITLLLVVVLRVIEAGVEDIHEAFDCGLCAVLSLSLILELAFRYRLRTRGYAYGRSLVARLLRRSRPDEQDQGVYLDRLRSNAAEGGPILAGADEPAGQAIVEAIARESARQFSFRTARDSRDPAWERLEVRHLYLWFAAFPAALWRVPPAMDSVRSMTASEIAVHGYFSVVVPIDETSYEDIKLGLLPTLCARLDPQRVALGPVRGGTPLRLLAYAHVAVMPNHAPPAPELMLASSLGHIASLLARFYPERSAWQSTCQFSILCESSNASQSDALRTFGFTEVQQSHEDRAAPVRSPAGFSLYEAHVTPGQEDGGLLSLIASALPEATPQPVGPPGSSWQPGSTAEPHTGDSTVHGGAQPPPLRERA